MGEIETATTAPRLRSAANSKLPIASIVDDPDLFKQVVKLLKEGTAVKVKLSELSDREKQIKEELAAICEAYGTKGLRHGLNAFYYDGYVTKKTLSKEKLLAAGVPAEVISDSYVDSAPFLSTKIQPFDVE